jgi:head-tail adaptor
MAKRGIQIGDLNQRIKIVERSRSPDLDYGFEEVMTQIAEVWAQVVQLQPVSFDRDATTEEGIEPTHRFIVRRDARRVLPPNTTYVLWKGKNQEYRRYKVEGVRELLDTKGTYLVLECYAEQVEAGQVQRPISLITEQGQRITL